MHVERQICVSAGQVDGVWDGFPRVAPGDDAMLGPGMRCFFQESFILIWDMKGYGLLRRMEVNEQVGGNTFALMPWQGRRFPPPTPAS